MSSQEQSLVSATGDATSKGESAGRKSKKEKRSCSETISLIVRRDSVQGVIDSGLRQQRFLGRLLHYIPGISHRRVRVEANKNCAASSVYFVPEKKGITPCQFKKVKPNAENVVLRTDEYFISFVGMSISAYDNETGFNSHKTDNELLMYSQQCRTGSQGLSSVQKAVDEDREREEFSQKRVAEDPTQNEDVDSTMPPSKEVGQTTHMVQQTAQNTPVTTGFVSKDSVFIHYDPVVDARNTGTKADTFVNIPATKRLYACSEQLQSSTEAFDDNDRDSHCLESLFMRFTVMEIDRISDLQARAVIGVDHFGSFVSKSAGSIPYIQLLTKAFAVASSVGKKGLLSYSKPDHVITVDKEFYLSNPQKDGEGASNTDETKEENYLRYGYYFFLSKKVQAKLYAMTNSADESIQLKMKRTDINPRSGRRECQYVPLTEVSYVVMKVRRGCCNLSHARIARRSEGHQLRLDNMLSMSTAIEVLAEAERKKGRRTSML
ncbi:unnamed protein product [Agarophyton chilense]